MSAPFASPESEATPEGEQMLIAGVRSISVRERLLFKAMAPLEARAAQKHCDHGLFDLAARGQTDLIDELRRLERLSFPTPTKEKQA